jgi:hypothetical protein
MRAIFISYRRDDTEGQAGHLFNDLARSFGKDAVFMDVAAIEPGRDFRRVIDDHVASCGVLLTLLGRGWLNATNEAGQRRLDDPMDFVRLETAAALKRDIPVVPVLVHGAKMPRADELPDDLKELAFRNSVELTHARWDSDMEVLIKALRPYVQAQPGSATPTAEPLQPPAHQEPARKTKSPVAMYAAVGAAVLLGGGAFVWFGQTPRKATDVAATTAATTVALPQAPKASVPGAGTPIKEPVTEPPVINKTVAKPPPKSGNPPHSPPAANKQDVKQPPDPEPPPTTAPVRIAKADWSGVWKLSSSYNNQSADWILTLTPSPDHVYGRYESGRLKGTFVNDNHASISGEVEYAAGVVCANGKQFGRFSFTMSRDGRLLTGWWDLCGEGQKFSWTATRRR